MTEKKIFRLVLKRLPAIMPGLFLFFQACNTEYFDPPVPDENLLFLSKGLFSRANDIIFTSDGNLVIAGEFSEAQNDTLLTGPPADFVVAKTDLEGNILWKRNIESPFGNRATRVKQLSDERFVVLSLVSDTNELGVLQTSIGISRINASGLFAWQKVYGGKGNQVGYDIEETPDGGFIIAGSTDYTGLPDPGTEPGPRDVFLLKLSGDGDSLWSERIGYPGDDYATDIGVYPDGSLLITGSTRQSFTGQADYNIFLIRTNSMGKGPVNRILGGMAEERGVGLVLSSDGFYVAANKFQGPASSILLYRFGENFFGEPLFIKEYTFDSNVSLTTFLSKESQFFLAGSAGSPGEEKILVARLDGQGDLIRKREAGGSMAQKTLAMDFMEGSKILVLFENEFLSGNIPGFLIIDMDSGP